MAKGKERGLMVGRNEFGSAEKQPLITEAEQRREMVTTLFPAEFIGAYQRASAV